MDRVGGIGWRARQVLSGEMTRSALLNLRKSLPARCDGLVPAEPNASAAYEEAHSAEGGTDTAAGESAPVPAPTLAEGDVPGNAGVDWSVPDWVRHPRLGRVSELMR